MRHEVDHITHKHRQKHKHVIKSINQQNMIRNQERCRLINKDNILLEIYMKRMMHPRYLEPLRQNEDVEVDEFMSRYVESL